MYQRGDGVIIDTSLDEIRQRIDRAEYAASHLCNNSSMWMRYYDDGVENNVLINDFKALLGEVAELRRINDDAKNRLESLGWDVDKKGW